jgi:PAS domain S-box-containing protein
MTTRVKQHSVEVSAPAVLKSVLAEFSAVTDYRTLRDSLPRRLSSLLKCRHVLLYQCIGETLQFASGTFDERPGWSSLLLDFVHINPIDIKGDTPEARAWRLRSVVTMPAESPTPTLVSVPLIYRQHAIGVLVAIRGGADSSEEGCYDYWTGEEVEVVEVVAGVSAMLLENTRLLERDRERIHELSLLNSISSQLHHSMYELNRIRSIVVQRTQEVSSADLCELILPSTPEDTITWITPALRELLFHPKNGAQEPGSTPLVIERLTIGEQALEGTTIAAIGRTLPTSVPTILHIYPHNEYLRQLPANIKTFFAIPLISSSTGEGSKRAGEIPARRGEAGQKVLGVLVGAYYRPWKLRHEELVLLRVLAGQASAILENIYLMAKVTEARTEARKLLRQVLDDQRLKELILESIPSGLITVDLNGNITTFNRAAEAVLRYHLAEVLGQPVKKILDLRLFSPSLIDKEERCSGLVTSDRYGREVVLDVAVSALLDERGVHIGALITFNDVTSIHRLEEEKRRLDRLAALGEMAANVAHEVRNPLASIKTSVQLLLDDLAKNSNDPAIFADEESRIEAQESVSIVLKEVERLDAIVRDLLLFAKPRQLYRTPCNLLELSDRVLRMMQTRYEEAGIVVHRKYRPVPAVHVDVAQMEQVLFNLYLNAVQAMPDGGVLSISCQEIPDWIELIVSDSGVGISPDQIEHIFQPFFTTRAHGIGLGLPITRRLIEDHHGYIFVESQLGYGTTITVRLPLMEE